MSEPQTPPKKSRREFMLLLLPSLIVLLAILLGIGKGVVDKMSKTQGPETVDSTNVGVETIRKQPYSEIHELPGRVIADKHVVVSSEIVGRIASWNVAEGGTVEAGKPLAKLDVQALDARLAEVAAGLTSAKTSVVAQTESVKVAKLRVGIAKREAMNAQNNVEVAKGDLTVAMSELARAEKLFKQGVRTESDIERIKNDAFRSKAMVSNAENARVAARDQVTSAEAAVAQADAALGAAKARVAELEAASKSVRVQIGKSTILSPIDGILDKYVRDVGEVVNPGEVMGHVYDFDHIRVSVDVADRYLPFLQPTNPLIKQYVTKNFSGAIQKLETTLRLHGLPKLGDGRSSDLELPAVVARIGQAADTLSNTFELELRAVNPAGIFKQGQLVKVAIKMLEYPEAILIPMTALRVTDEGQRCMVAVEEEGLHHAVARAVVVVSVKGDHALVTGDLQVGDLLVSSNVQELLEGEKITIVTKDGNPFKGEASTKADE